MLKKNAGVKITTLGVQRRPTSVPIAPGREVIDIKAVFRRVTQPAAEIVTGRRAPLRRTDP
jgi:hypothetical protein